MEVTETTAQDILVTACEGGIGYWSVVDRYAPSEIEADIIDTVTGRTYLITETVINHGRAAILAGKVEIAPDIKKSIQDDDIDAAAADCIVQAGLFGELLYS